MNKHGLSRDIPSAVMREVRQRAGFGCVICGSAIYTYEHIDDYIHVDIHDPEKMTLLCANHQTMVTGRSLSKDTVRRAAKDPCCRKKGFTFGAFDVNDRYPDIRVGTIHAYRTKTIIRAFGRSLFCIDKPEEPGGPFRISAFLYGRDGRETLRIVDNEWRASTGSWDVERTERHIIIRAALGDVILRLRTDPPSSLTIERLESYYHGAKISCLEGRHLTVTLPNGTLLKAYSARADGCDVGLDIIGESIIVGRGGNLVLGNYTSTNLTRKSELEK